VSERLRRGGSTEGDLWLPPYAYITGMATAISRIYTPEGFVVASDSRKADPGDRKDVVDGVQKIFQISAINVCYGIAGVVQFTDADGIGEFDFREACERATKVVAQGKSKGWPEYVSALRRAIAKSLDDLRRSATKSVPEPTDTHIFLAGFYHKHPRCARIQFTHGPNRSTSYDRIEDLERMMLYGSDKVWDSLFKEDPRFSGFLIPPRRGIATLPTAIDRARNDIRAHYDPMAHEIDGARCWAIGGPVHMATITLAEGFQWVAGFVPTAA
jgi:hypothetical protein